MAQAYRVAVIPGDVLGSEVVCQGLRGLRAGSGHFDNRLAAINTVALMFA